MIIPGSMSPTASEVYQEGLRIPPVKFYERGQPSRSVQAFIRANVRVPDIVLAGTETWARLTPEERRWLQEAADESAAFQRELWSQQTGEALEQLAAAGVEVSRPDPLPFQEAVQDLHAAYRGTEAGRWMERVRAEP